MLPKIILLAIFVIIIVLVTPLSYPLFGSSFLLMMSKSKQPNSSNVDSIEKENLPSTSLKNCDIFSGEWVPNPKGPYYTNKTCWAIHEHQNCMKYGRPDSEFMKWRWKPNECELPIFNPFQFLEIVRGKSMAFVGDSVGRNHMQSLICLLSRVSFTSTLLQFWCKFCLKKIIIVFYFLFLSFALVPFFMSMLIIVALVISDLACGVIVSFFYLHKLLNRKYHQSMIHYLLQWQFIEALIHIDKKIYHCAPWSSL